MSESNKLGPYIQRLMTTILDKEQEEFVTNLALSELKRLNSDIHDFVIKNEVPEHEKHTEKELLTEERAKGYTKEQTKEWLDSVKNKQEKQDGKMFRV